MNSKEEISQPDSKGMKDMPYETLIDLFRLHQQDPQSALTLLGYIYKHPEFKIAMRPAVKELIKTK